MDLVEGSRPSGEEHSQGEAYFFAAEAGRNGRRRGVVNHAGARMLVDLADVTGLSAAVSEALAPLRQRDSATARAGSLSTWR